MLNLIGEFECKIDVKGRLMLPSSLKKQLPEGEQEKFVLNRGFENCLVMYPLTEWNKIIAEVNKLNLYNKKNRDFVRFFYRGASEISIDNSNRLLLPKNLLEYANVDKDIVLFAFSNRIEIWSKTNYDGLLVDEPEDFAKLAEDVMGKQDKEDKNDDVS
ncbi:MAG: division/cell wall cluster transcriptional repressor MraZ [Bacteroidetes bacterium CG2_30_32_10]|nr:MAG: division/cell wall cluster transcriptional repressor MraZ [Bacteroidetes bacterium CG2_30_32_10]